MTILERLEERAELLRELLLFVEEREAEARTMRDSHYFTRRSLWAEMRQYLERIKRDDATDCRVLRAKKRRAERLAKKRACDGTGRGGHG